MEVQGAKVLVLGGWGLVGQAVCRELLQRRPHELQIHSLKLEEAEDAKAALLPVAGETRLTAVSGDVFGLAGSADRRQLLAAQLRSLGPDDLRRFRLYQILAELRPEVVIDCVNTATVIAYRDLFSASAKALDALDADDPDAESMEQLLEALYVPRLVRHIQILYRGMIEAGTRVFIKVGTSGTGGMGLNIPYTHSEERPSRVLLSKSAMAGAQSMLLFLMARTPGAPITKEIKPAAAIAWKKIDHGPIYRRGSPIHKVEASPQALGATFSTEDGLGSTRLDDILECAYIDTGENGIFSLEEFATLTTAEQMEFVTPEEIARYLVFEIEGGNTGHDIINALDNAVLGPTYRAGLMRHWALERMNAIEREHGGSRSVAFEMLGPPRITKLLFEAHFLRSAFATMADVRDSQPAEVSARLVDLLTEQPELANEAAAVGIPVLLPGDRIIRGPSVIVPAEQVEEEVTSEKIDAWAHDGWADLRPSNCARWIDRFRRIHDEIESIPAGDSSSHHLRTRGFWAEGNEIQPGKVVGWVLAGEEHGARIK